jgi:chromate transport protein ChrA
MEPSANWVLAPVGVVLIGYTAANAAGVLPAAILVAVIAATLSFIQPQRWLVWGVLAALSVPTGLASAALAGLPTDLQTSATTLTLASALAPALLGAGAGRWLRSKLETER